MGKKTLSIEVVEIATGKVVHRVDVSGKTETQIDRIDMGMLRQMDLERYSTRYSTKPAESGGSPSAAREG